MLRKKTFTASTLIALPVCLISGALGSHPATADSGGEGFGRKIAGTYLITEEQSEIPEAYTRLLTLFADGNMSSIQALQFGLGIPGFAPFSDEQGAWKKTGKTEVTAKAITLTYDSTDGAGLFNCLTTIDMDFHDNFHRISGRKNGKCYEPVTVNPLDPGNAEVAFQFSGSFEGQRITVDNGEKDKHH